MTFPIEKILTVSASEYIKNNYHGVGYDMSGVHVELRPDNEDRLINAFSENVPENAEVVVDYRVSISNAVSTVSDWLFRTASGTALIPREKGPRPSAAEVERALDSY